MKREFLGAEVTLLITSDGVMKSLQIGIDVGCLYHFSISLRNLLIIVFQRTSHGRTGCHNLDNHPTMA